MTIEKILAGMLLVPPVIGVPLNAQNVPNNPAIPTEVLLKRLEELEHQVKVLSRKGELADEAAADKAKSAVTVSAGSGGLEVRSADTNFVLKVRGYIQADSRWFLGDDVTGNDSFLLRRVRPIFEGTVFEKFDYRLMLDFGSGVTASAANNAYVQDAYVNARLSRQFQVQAGKFKEPVGLERLQSGANLLFIERAYPSQILPNRDVGVMVHGEFFNGALNYAAGIFNGVADGGSGDIDTADGDKDFAGRLFAHPFKNSNIEALQGLGIGIAGTFGEHSGSLRSFSSPGQQTFFSYYNGSGTNALTVSDGNEWRLSPQAYYYWRSFGILAEYAISSPEVRRTGGGVAGSATDRLHHTGWQVAASYFLTGEDNGFRAVTPRRPFSLGGDGWGAWEVAARVSQLKLDDATFPLFANPQTSAREALSYTLGLNWHLNRNVKASVNYEHTDFRGGDGNPITQSDENVILTRAQISF